MEECLKLSVTNINEARALGKRLPYHQLMELAARYGSDDPRLTTEILKQIKPIDTPAPQLVNLRVCGNCRKVCHKSECRIKTPVLKWLCEDCEVLGE